MIYNGSDDSIQFSSNASEGPNYDYPQKKTENIKNNKKWVYIIAIISVIVLLIIGIFLAIFFAIKQQENGGQIFVLYSFESSGIREIMKIDNLVLDESDYEVINTDENGRKKIRVLNDEKKNFQMVERGQNYFIIKFNKIITSMNGMFANLDNLIYADFSGLVSKKIINMNNLFLNCRNLLKVNFNNFDAQKLETMKSCFENCYEITDIDLNSFNTPKLYSMKSAFKNCTNLVSLNIESFLINSNVELNDVFTGIDNNTFFQLPDNDRIHEEKNKLNTTKNRTCEVGTTGGCKICSKPVLKNITTCEECMDSFFLPIGNYPFKCQKCPDNCLICNDTHRCNNNNCADDFSDFDGQCVPNIIPSDTISVINSDIPSF